MYEQAFRLSIDNTDTCIKILEKQCKCYIAAINSLNLVKKEDAWIVKPFLNEEMDVVISDSPRVRLWILPLCDFPIIIFIWERERERSVNAHQNVKFLTLNFSRI